MNLKFCSCRMCRSGRGTRWGQHVIVSAKRKNRHRTKVFLKTGEYLRIENKVSVPYTD